MLGSDTPGVALMVDCSAFMDRDIVYLGSSVLGLTSRLSLALDFLIAIDDEGEGKGGSTADSRPCSPGVLLLVYAVAFVDNVFLK